jgi:hypothetical protein
MVVAIPILIALFGACLQLLHLGIAHIVVELAAYEATRLATLDNMNIAEARRTAEEICRVLGPGLTEVKYQANPPGYEIIHHLRPIVPVIRELTVKHSLPSYVFLPGYELEPGSAVSPSQNRGGGGGGSPGYGRGGRGSGIEVADYDPDDYPNDGYSRSTYSSSQETYPQYAAAANPQTLPQGLEPFRAPPGVDADYPSDLSDYEEDPDEDRSLDTYLAESRDASSDITGSSAAGALPGSSRSARDYLAAGASAVGRSIWPMPLLPTDTIAEAGKRARDKSDEIGEDEQAESAVTEQEPKEHGNVLLALASGAKDGYLGPSQGRGSELPNVKFANETETAYKKKSKQYQTALDEMDQEADKEKGLKKIRDKAKIKATQAAAAGSDILVEAVLDIPKVGQDLPEAVENTKAIGKNLKEKKYKEALYSAGKAAGLGLKEVDRLNPLKGVAQGIGKKLVKQAGKKIVEDVGVKAGKKAEKKAINKIQNRLPREVRQERAKSGQIVLGKGSTYRTKGDEIGAKTFEIPDEIWKKMTPEQQWAANRKALDRAIARGDRIALSNPINDLTNTGAFKKEVDYLKSKGYEISSDGLELIKRR